MLLYNKIIMQIVIAFISIIIFSQVSNADIGKETGLEIPRYVSLKSNDANIRVGPSKNYPIEIKYIKNNYPLKVLEEYEDWRKVEDFQKNFGWIHKSLISGSRTGIVLSNDNKTIKLLNTKCDHSVPTLENDYLLLDFLAGAVGFEPTNADSKNRCLTAWRRPKLRLLSSI